MSLPSEFKATRAQDSEASVSYISRIVPIANGSNISAGSNIQFRLPTQMNAFLDCKNSFLKFTVRNAGGHKFTLPKAGAGALFSSIAVTSGGSMIDQRNNYNVWRTVQHCQKATQASTSVMNTLLGCGTDKKMGVEIAGGQTKTFCDPIKNHASIFDTATHYMPLFAAELEMVYTLCPADLMGFWASSASSVADSDLVLEGVELVLSCIQLPSKSVEDLVALHNGVLVFEGQSYGVSTNTLVQANGQVTLPISMGYTNAQKVDFVMTPKTTADGTGLARIKNDVKSVFVKNGLTQWGLLSDGMLVEASRQVRASDAECLAMEMIELNMLGDIESADLIYKSQADVSLEALPNEETPAAGLNDGSFIGSLSLCSFKNGKERQLCSGRNFVNATNSIQLDFTPGGTNTSTVVLDVFTTYRTVISIDLKNGGMYTVLH